MRRVTVGYIARSGKRWIIYLFLLVPVVANSFDFTFRSGGPSNLTVEEAILRKMAEPNIKVVRDQQKIIRCEMIKKFNLEKIDNNWMIGEKSRENQLVDLKKKTFLLSGDTLLLYIDHRGHPKGLTAIAYRCKL